MKTKRYHSVQGLSDRDSPHQSTTSLRLLQLLAKAKAIILSCVQHRPAVVKMNGLTAAAARRCTASSGCYDYEAVTKKLTAAAACRFLSSAPPVVAYVPSVRHYSTS